MQQNMTHKTASETVKNPVILCWFSFYVDHHWKKWLFMVMYKIFWIRYWPCISLIWNSSNTRIMTNISTAVYMRHFILCHLIRHLTLLLFADTWSTYSCIHRNSIYLRVGEKELSVHRDVEHFLMLKTFCLELSDQKPRHGRIGFFFGRGGGLGWWWIKLV